MSTIQLCAVCIPLFLTSVLAVDYIFTLQEEGATACPGSEDFFLDTYLDLSNIGWKQIDEENIILQGYVIFIKKLDSKLHLNVKVEKLSSGRWMETAFQIDRPDVCASFFDKYEIWYDFMKETQVSSKKCPPNEGTKYEFKDKKLSTLLRDLAPGMEGAYKSTFKVFIGDEIAFCMSIEGDLLRKYTN